MQVHPIRAVDGLVVLECVSRSRRVSVMLVLDFPDERLHFDPIDGVSVQDDSTPEAAEDAAEVQRFLGHYFANGQLEVWARHNNLLSRCNLFIPVNVDLGATVNNFLKAEKSCREAAANRRSVREAQPIAPGDAPQAAPP